MGQGGFLSQLICDKLRFQFKIKHIFSKRSHLERWNEILTVAILNLFFLVKKRKAGHCRNWLNPGFDVS